MSLPQSAVIYFRSDALELASVLGLIRQHGHKRIRLTRPIENYGRQGVLLHQRIPQ